MRGTRFPTEPTASAPAASAWNSPRPAVAAEGPATAPRVLRRAASPAPRLPTALARAGKSRVGKTFLEIRRTMFGELSASLRRGQTNWFLAQSGSMRNAGSPNPIRAILGIKPSSFFLAASLLEAPQPVPLPSHAALIAQLEPGVVAERLRILRREHNACPSGLLFG
jgi:hypothetical protein